MEYQCVVQSSTWASHQAGVGFQILWCHQGDPKRDLRSRWHASYLHVQGRIDLKIILTNNNNNNNNNNNYLEALLRSGDINYASIGNNYNNNNDDDDDNNNDNDNNNINNNNNNNYDDDNYKKIIVISIINNNITNYHEFMWCPHNFLGFRSDYNYRIIIQH